MVGMNDNRNAIHIGNSMNMLSSGYGTADSHRFIFIFQPFAGKKDAASV